MPTDHRPRFRLELLHPRHWAKWGVLLACFGCALLPARARAWLGDAFARRLLAGDGRRRRIALTNLELCGIGADEAEREALLAAHARVACRVALEYGPLMFRSRRYLLERVDIEGLEHVRRAEDEGYNVIALSPHFVALEHAGLRLSLEQRIATMIRVHEDPAADWIATRMRTCTGARLFRHDAGLLSLVRTIRRGAWFYYLPDEDRGRAGMVFAPFFGVPKATVPALARLARAAHAVVLPVRSAFSPETGRFSVRFYAPATDLESPDPTEEAARMNRLLERLVREAPEQYLWTQKIFRTRPPGEASVYHAKRRRRRDPTRPTAA